MPPLASAAPLLELEVGTSTTTVFAKSLPSVLCSGQEASASRQVSPLETQNIAEDALLRVPVPTSPDSCTPNTEAMEDAASVQRTAARCRPTPDPNPCQKCPEALEETLHPSSPRPRSCSSSSSCTLRATRSMAPYHLETVGSSSVSLPRCSGQTFEDRVSVLPCKRVLGSVDVPAGQSATLHDTSSCPPPSNRHHSSPTCVEAVGICTACCSKETGGASACCPLVW